MNWISKLFTIMTDISARTLINLYDFSTSTASCFSTSGSRSCRKSWPSLQTDTTISLGARTTTLFCHLEQQPIGHINILISLVTHKEAWSLSLKTPSIRSLHTIIQGKIYKTCSATHLLGFQKLQTVSWWGSIWIMISCSIETYGLVFVACVSIF